MKKLFYATTALASLGFIAGAASDAVAGERIRLGLSGFHQQWGVYANQNIPTPGNNAAGQGNKIKTVPVDQKHNSEICVIGETTLDNAITVGVNVQIEANTDSDTIDETYLYVQHPQAGQLILGDENNAGYLLHVTSPDGGVSLDSGDLLNIDAWANSANQSYFDTMIGTTNLRLNDNDSGKFTYISPRFFGVQAGVSFIPTLESGGDCNSSASFNNTAVNLGGGPGCRTNTNRNGWAGGLNYREKFGDFGVQASGGVLWARSGKTGFNTGPSRNDSDLFGWNIGAQFSFAGFSVGGAYGAAPNKNSIRNASAAGPGAAGAASFQSNSWTVGGAYEWGPYKVGITWMSGEGEGLVNFSQDTRLDQGVISATYTLGPGIRLVGGFFIYDADAEIPGTGARNPNPAVTGFNNSGWGFASGLKLAF